jgi:hypothetical protein
MLLVMPFTGYAQFLFMTNADGTITITGYIGPGGGVTIPGMINGLPVTAIDREAFFYHGSVTSVEIPDGVISIGSNAFGDCANLTSVTIPNSVTNVGDGAFCSCTNLTNITVAAQNPAYASIGGVLFNHIATSLVQYPAGLRGSYVIPRGVTSIESLAFSSCSGLTNVAIPSSVTRIGTAAFDYCPDLTSVTVPDSVTTIGDWAFEACNGLTNATIGGSVTNIGRGAFSTCERLTNLILGNSVTSIDDFAFDDCSSLTNVTIPDSVTIIGSMAFDYCDNLTNVSFGNGLTSIGYESFAFCANLASVTIPNSVTGIGSYAFCGCARLTKVFFQGNTPAADDTVFWDDVGTVYYVPGTTGWTDTFGGWPTAPLYQPNPLILDSSYGLGVSSNQFNFTVCWGTNASVVTETCTNLADPHWTPLATNALTNGVCTFVDPQWTNYLSCFYRVRSQ